MKTAIVDVCHTLYKSNTTFDYIDFVLNKMNRKTTLIKIKPIKYILIIMGRVLHKDIYRYLYIKKLKGFKKIELEDIANEFYRDKLDRLKILSTFNIINNEKNNYKFILASASLNIVIEAIIKNEKIFEGIAYSSNLDFKNDICTGKLSQDLLGNKHKYFSEVNWVITDNISDLKLAKKSEKVTILSKPKNIAFWERNGFKVDIII
ncbi:HAD family hydrolase [Enterobacter cloacae]|uniref:HAD family hydrolase n=1 Tax=Enterobacter cloacae TaxID=550 RepID=UPI001A339236|nr:haloacid dehalogenase-like hydrolase [Enterobacter cloacae]